MQVDDGTLAAGRVRLDIDGESAVLTLNRPGSLNAQTPATWLALGRVRALLPAEVRVLVVAGAGRAFSAGLDRAAFTDGTLTAIADLPAAVADARIAEFQEAFRWLSDHGLITVAAVQGPAVGAGCQLALACHLTVAADDAMFALFEVALGLVPDLGGLGRLVAAVGERRALEIAATGRRVGAAEAYRIGLVHRVVPAAELPAATRELVSSILVNPAAAVRAVTGLVVGAAGRQPAAQLALERAAQLALLRAARG